jgi:AhpD family alkylhydroperoxidase
MPPKKTQMSRFQIHDDLTAPEASMPILRGALASAGQLPNFIGVLAGSPAALRGYARFRSELRHGALALPTLERVALAVAQEYGSEPGLALHTRTARQAGLSVDEIALAREWDSRDDHEALLLRYLKTDEQLLEAIAFASIESFTAMVNIAGDVPADGSNEQARQLRAA